MVRGTEKGWVQEKFRGENRQSLVTGHGVEGESAVQDDSWVLA